MNARHILSLLPMLVSVSSKKLIHKSKNQVFLVMPG